MSTLENLQNLLVQAMKAKDEVALRTWRMLIAKIKTFEIDNGKPASEQDIINIALQEEKKRKEAANLYEQGGRMELLEQELAEARVLATILPARLDTAELHKKVEEFLSGKNYTMKDMGLVIKSLKEELGGAVDGAELAKVVKDQLQSS